jgi:hypothetical protein
MYYGHEKFYGTGPCYKALMRPYYRVASLLPGLEFARKYQTRMDLVGTSLFRDVLNFQSTRIVFTTLHFLLNL